MPKDENQDNSPQKPDLSHLDEELQKRLQDVRDITEEKFEELDALDPIDRARKGFDEWNAWAKYILVNKIGRRGKSIDFSSKSFDVGIIPMGFIFPYHATFIQTKFYCDIWFQNCLFVGGVYFSNATFNDVARFVEVTFLDTVVFSGITFKKDVFFTNSTFCNDFEFLDTVFSSIACFSMVSCEKKAKFNGATFKKLARFSDATFEDTADFSGVHFERVCNFNEVVFRDAVNFQNATFEDIAHFSVKKFGGIARFSSATFKKLARFSGAIFEGTADFSGVHFEKVCSFNDAEMKKGIRFTDSTFKASANFEGAQFHGHVPDLRRTSFGAHFSMHNVDITPFTPSDDDKENKRREDCYRRLKELTKGSEDHKNELEFFSQELRAERYLTDSLWKKASYSLYEIFSDYGRSLARPFWSLVYLFVMFSLLGYFLDDGIFLISEFSIYWIFCLALLSVPFGIAIPLSLMHFLLSMFTKSNYQKLLKKLKVWAIIIRGNVRLNLLFGLASIYLHYIFLKAFILNNSLSLEQIEINATLSLTMLLPFIPVSRMALMDITIPENQTTFQYLLYFESLLGITFIFLFILALRNRFRL